MGLRALQRLLAVLTIAYASIPLDGEYLDPATYTSASGAYVLRVMPTSRTGEGVATYRLSREGVVIWTREAPVTLWRAVVADDGTIGGFGYTIGQDGRRGPTDFVVARIDASGAFEELLRRPRNTRPLHGHDSPFATGVRIDEVGATFIVDVVVDAWSGRDLSWSFPLTGDAPMTESVPTPLSEAAVKGTSVAHPTLAVDDVPHRDLPLIASFRLTPADGAAWQPVTDFVVDRTGRIGVVATPDCGGDELVVSTLRALSADGVVESEVELPASTCDVTVATGEVDWWVALEDGDAGSTVSRFDPRLGTLVAVAGYDGSRITALAGLDAGFVALIQQPGEGACETVTLRAYDATGRERWRYDGAATDHEIDSDAQVVVTRAGTIVILTIGGDSLDTFDADGKFLGRVALASSWGRKPNFPAGIAAGDGDTVIVHDWGAPSVAVNMSLDGGVLAQFSPAFADGRRPAVHGRVHAAPGDHYWMSDGHALLRLDATGRVTETVGNGPDDDVLGVVAGIAITRNGHVHAVDERTGAVHVLDAQARPLRVCHASPGDVDGISEGEISASATGEIFVQHRGSGEPQDRIRFDSTCRRVGTVAVGAGDVWQDWLSHPAGGATHWIVMHDGVRLADGAHVRRTIDRTRDGHWLLPRAAGVAPDGTLIVASNVDGRGNGLQSFMVTFSAAGEPLHTWPLPERYATTQSKLAFDGNSVVVAITDEHSIPRELLAVGATGTPRFRFRPSTGREPYDVAFVDGPQGQELWTFDGEGTIDRYAWPLASP